MKNTIIIICAILLMAASCKKKKADPHVPPDMSFKSGTNYTSGDLTTNKQDTLLIGINVTKTEDDLKSYNVSYSYDGSTTTTTFYNYYLAEAEYGGYSKDITIITRNQNGKEKWVFTIVDRDGNLAQKTINITVQ
jgi:hypothetical protein